MTTFTTDSTNTYVTTPPPIYMPLVFLIPNVLSSSDPKTTGQLWPRGNW